MDAITSPHFTVFSGRLSGLEPMSVSVEIKIKVKF